MREEDSLIMSMFTMSLKTLSLLWGARGAKCEAEHAIPYQHSQFNDKYHAYAASKKSNSRIKRKPGETQ